MRSLRIKHGALEIFSGALIHCPKRGGIQAAEASAAIGGASLPLGLGSNAFSLSPARPADSPSWGLTPHSSTIYR